MTTTNFPKRARREDPHGHMVVQENLDTLRDVVDKTKDTGKGGSATISTGNTSVPVTHGLGISAYRVSVVPLADPGSPWWVSGKSSTGFTINIQAALGSNLIFDWSVKGD